MQNSVNISTKTELISFIIFKRKLRKQLKKLFYIFIAFVFCVLLVFCFYKRTIISNFFIKNYNSIVKMMDNLLEVKINKVRVHLEKNSIINDNDVSEIIDKLSGENINKHQMQLLINDILAKNKLIENIYIKKTLANEDLSVYIKEKKIIGIYYSDECFDLKNNCSKNLITINNNIISYHDMKTNENILKIYGVINSIDIHNIYNFLKKYQLIEKINYIRFYTSGRFDIMLKNNLLLKIPKQNWKKSIQRFNKLDAEFLLSKDIQNIKHIDLRVEDKILVR